MKLWVKFAIVTVLVLLLGTGISGAAVIYHAASYNRQRTMESSKGQLRSAAYALGREMERGLLAEYSEAAKYSYLNFLVKKFDASQYILLEEGSVVVNQTPFILENPQDERWQGEEEVCLIQKAETGYFLVTGKKIPMEGKSNYALVLVKDVSLMYEDIRRQLYFALLVEAGGALLSVVLIFWLTRYLLKPLKELQQAAGDISRGELKRRAGVHTKDEIGDMAVSFNSMADKIEEQMAALSEEAGKQRELFGSLTHELKTPMTSIIGYSDTLLHVKLKKEQQERALLHIHDECKRLERLSSKLMHLIGLYDNDSICLEQVEMKALFEQVVHLEKHHLQQKKLTLRHFCTMGSYMLDKDLFESLLMNLIDNAAKASPEGAVIELTGEENVISVRDYGHGIPADALSHVKEAFYMVDKARSRKSGGSGLGLSLCSRIARLHGAELVIESRMGEGTCVSVVFEEKKDELHDASKCAE